MGKASPKFWLQFKNSRYSRITVFAALLIFASMFGATAALAQTKTLKLYYIHTGEKVEATFKKNGKFLPDGLKKVNWALRDWRHNEPTKMDPRLLDLVWEAYRQSGSKQYIHVISGYRSPASNNLLRKRGRGVAKNSQHMLGKAMDFFLPDVKLTKLREIGLKMQVGGVGYYPTSGSPFVHLDVGNVRHWPKMTRSQLAAIFPDGKTMHIPSDGKPLARYEQAVAEYQSRSSKGALVPEGKVSKKQLNFFQRLAGKTEEDEADDGNNDAAAPTPRTVKATTKVPAPEVAPETPAAKPEPEAPVQSETVVAALVKEPEIALPKRVPVPELAPRGTNLIKGTEIALAAPTPVEPETPVEAATEIVTEKPSVFASLNLPVPTRRPKYDNVQIAAAEKSNVLALDAAPSENGKNVQVAALSPQEIEDLRSLVRPSSSEASFAAPTPAIDVKNNTGVSSSDAIAAIVAETPKSEAEDATREEIQTASLKPSLATTEENSSATAPKTAKNIPIPMPSPRGNIVLASLETAKSPKVEQKADVKPIAAPKSEPKAEPKIASRPITLDKLSAPQENSTHLGQWALSSDVTIEKLAEVQAPAYGRNSLRKIPDTILVQGFNLQPFGPGQNNFKGRAVPAQRFAKIQIN